MTKRCLWLFSIVLLLFMLPTVPCLGESGQGRVDELTIGLFTPDLFEADEVFDEAVCCLKEVYPQIQLRYRIPSKGAVCSGHAGWSGRAVHQ